MNNPLSGKPQYVRHAQSDLLLLSEMNMKSIIIALIAFAAGFTAHLMFSRAAASPPDPKDAAAQHWRLVNYYNAYMADPANWKGGAATPPVDHEPSLAALVSARELEHVDLLFPTVPKKS